VDEIKASGGEAFAVAADVANEVDVAIIFDRTLQQYGMVDILINNAGIMDNFMPAGQVTDATWERVLAVNLTGVMRTTRKALPLFIEKNKGIIVNIASIGGLQGSRAGAAYTASKHAVIGLSKNVAYQYLQHGIRCNVIAPGGVNTNIGTTMNEPNPLGMEKAMSGINYNPRMGEPSEIATIALFLATDESSLMNGAVLTADSGWTAY
jgi:NAD(P)-dependent dehydrogenase (short-subunit alcohol dehydrogenase family)